MNFTSYGEVLFDVFPNEKKIGGAPLNLALRTASFGNVVNMISAVGEDQQGEEILKYCRDKGVNTSGISVVKELPTGIVQVFVNERGSATYEIKYPSAWDFISLEDHTVSIVQNSDVFFYGSLVCRNRDSKQTLFHLLEANPEMFKVFDVNLRAPHYSFDILLELMGFADFIKFNDEEIVELAKAYDFDSENLEECMYFFSKKTQTANICVTRGKHGSLLLWNEQFVEHQGYPVEVVDTVGAGDSFLSTLVVHLLSGSDVSQALDVASAVGAMVAGSKGANPVISREMILDFQKSAVQK